jgi:tetraacyldisaccharide 4'-kinase
MISTPSYWFDAEPPSWARPLSSLYQFGRWLHTSTHHPVISPLPTLCVGNLTAGGGGKTPVVQALARLMRRPDLFILTRGYGGTITKPTRVLPDHMAQQVGDEAKLLTTSAPVVIAQNRLAGAKMIAAEGGQIILMDDGLQNRDIQAHMNILVIDGTIGFGNGWCLPAGPLREPLADLLPRVHAGIMVGPDMRDVRALLPPELPVFQARPIYGSHHIDIARRYVAFAGLARPQKFFEALRSLGIQVAATQPLPDHTPYDLNLIDSLIDLSVQHHAHLITTAKDAIKWPRSFIEDGTLTVLTMDVTFDDDVGLTKFIHQHLGLT